MPFENSIIHGDSNSQSGSSLRSVGVHSLTLSYIPGSAKCDSWASFLARTFVSPCLGNKPKARVATIPNLRATCIDFFSTFLLQFVFPPCPLYLITSLNNFLTTHACHNLSLRLTTKAKACKGEGWKCNTIITFTFLECEKVWGNEPTHSQVDSHLGSYSPYRASNFQRIILGVKIH